MNDPSGLGATLGGGSLLIALLALLVLILWILLPFAVFGLKPRVDELIKQQKITNKLLSEVAASGGETGHETNESEPQTAGRKEPQFDQL